MNQISLPLTPEEYEEKARAAFLEGHNCAQSLVKAFKNLPQVQARIDETTLLSLASSFGGGIGRLREVCGAVSGMAIILGILYGYDGPETGAPKAEHYARIQEVAHRFEAVHGTLICRELLGLTLKHDAPTPEARTKEYYAKRPCEDFIGSAAKILAEYLEG